MQRAGIKMKKGKVVPVVLDDHKPNDADTMIFRAGCTFVFDLDTLDLKYVISKPLLASERGAGGKPKLDEARVRARFKIVETGPNAVSEFRQYFDMGFARGLTEPFALLHQH